jgi:hypothetical protein
MSNLDLIDLVAIKDVANKEYFEFLYNRMNEEQKKMNKT